jgi:predicted transcriptional regulator
MANLKRKRSDHVFELSSEQLEALLKIALKRDRPLEEIVLGAIDQYIKAEEKSYASTGNPN